MPPAGLAGSGGVNNLLNLWGENRVGNVNLGRKEGGKCEGMAGLRTRIRSFSDASVVLPAVVAEGRSCWQGSA